MENSSAKLIPPNSVIIAMYGDGDTAGRCAINKVAVTTNQACCNLIVNSEVAHYEYVFYYLKTQYNKLVGLKAGGGQQNLNAKTIREFPIAIPPLIEQRRIANILSTYDNFIETNCHRMKLLEEAAKCQYSLLMQSEIGGIKRTVLSDLAVVNESTLNSNYQGNILYIDISAVGTGIIRDKKPYSFKDAPGRARRRVKHGDTIWSCVRPNRKSFALVWEPEEELVVSTGFAVISPEKYPLFLYHAITTEDYVKYLESNATGSAYPAVTSRDFEISLLDVPTNKTALEKFERIIMPHFACISNLQEQNIRLREARDILLPRLMSGVIDLSTTSTIATNLQPVEND